VKHSVFPHCAVLGTGPCNSIPSILLESGSERPSLERSNEGVTAPWASYQVHAKVSEWMKAECEN